MATFIKFPKFIKALGDKKHDLGTDQMVLWLSNTAPTAATDDTLSDITQIAYTNLSTRSLVTTSWSESTGLILVDLTLTASGGTVGPFRYVGIYNDTSTNDDLVGGYYDYGSSITLADTETFAFDLGVNFFSVT